MNSGPSIVRRIGSEKSNTELTNSLRANFQASQLAWSTIANGSTISHQTWTQREGDVFYVPKIDFTTSGLQEERSQYDITVKLFFLPSTKAFKRSEHTQEAIKLVLKELRVASIDLLIVSFPGIAFDAEDDEDEDLEGDEQEAENMEDMVKTWKTLEKLKMNGTVAQIGLAEFGSERLEKFLPCTTVRPSVDQINIRDCCVVPKSLILYAKQEGIQLLTHNDCTDILPKGTIRELLGSGEKGAGVLAPACINGGTAGDIEPQWVVKYTAVVRDRGVIENKGYFAMAEVNEY